MSTSGLSVAQSDFNPFAKAFASRPDFSQSTVITEGRTPRKGNQRKEPEREFFEMTVLSFQLCNPTSKAIMTLDRNQMFKDCK